MDTLTLTLSLSLPSVAISASHRRYKLRRSISLSSPQISIKSPPSNSSPDIPNQTGVIVIGAGLSGLAAATKLKSQGIPFLLVEASDAVGGRVRTDVVDGFLLDRGFQIFITAYPEAQKVLDYEALNLQTFYSGAKVYYDGAFHTVADPVRHFQDSLKTLTNPIGTFFDKFLIALNRVRVLLKSDEEIFCSEEVSTIDLLRGSGFSESIIDRFFRPFFGGIFFDRELETTSRLFDFVFKCLALGDNTLPAKGISAIPEQLAAKLPAGSVLLNSRVRSINVESNSSANVELNNGDVLRSEKGVILAVEEPEAIKLLAGESVQLKKPARKTVCLYFSAELSQIPVKDPVLFINGSGNGIVNNIFFATNVAPSYGPPGKGLVSVSLIGLFEDVLDEDLTAEVVKEISDWFGGSMVGSWKHLRTYRIGFAQPNQSPPTDLMKDPRLGTGLYMCGDYLTSATFDGALVSGRRAVEALLKDEAFIQV